MKMKHNIKYASIDTAATLLGLVLMLAGCGGGGGDTAAAPTRKALSVPVNLDDSNRISAGPDFTLALASNGMLYAWGGNTYGQLGTGDLSDALTPIQVPGMSAVKALAAGGYHSAVLRTDGSVWNWGNNNFGQLGIGSYSEGAPTPRQVPGLSDVKGLSAGYTHTAVVLDDGTVWGWGSTPVKSSPVPVMVPELTNVKMISAGSDFNLALKFDGSLWAWGGNIFGQLGNGKRSAMEAVPTPVLGLSGVASVAAGYVHGLALKYDGTIWAWGGNTFEQLGSPGGNTSVARQVLGLPTPVYGGAAVRSVVAGTYNSAVVYADGSVWIWGSNLAGQFGDGTLNSSSVPVRISGLSAIVAVSLGDDFLVSLNNAGGGIGSGQNTRGQLGNNSRTDVTVSTPVLGLSGVGFLNLGRASVP
jgi:alpha-tubulin suppressor-like RCC1 family protein